MKKKTFRVEVKNRKARIIFNEEKLGNEKKKKKCFEYPNRGVIYDERMND